MKYWPCLPLTKAERRKAEYVSIINDRFQENKGCKLHHFSAGNVESLKVLIGKNKITENRNEITYVTKTNNTLSLWFPILHAREYSKYR